MNISEYKIGKLKWNFIKVKIYEVSNLNKYIWMADTLTTQMQYECLSGENPSKHKGKDLPVEMVSWYDSMIYAFRLSEKMILDGYITNDCDLRLPTEKEWGLVSECDGEWGGIAHTKHANFDGEAYLEFDSEAPNLGPCIGHTTPVKKYSPNSLGIYDIRGNVWDMCLNAYFKNGESIDGSGLVAASDLPEQSKKDMKMQTEKYESMYGRNYFGKKYEHKVRKGGSYLSAWDDCCSYRGCNLPNLRVGENGFRLVIDKKF